MDDHLTTHASTEPPSKPERLVLGHSMRLYRGKQIELELTPRIHEILTKLLNQKDDTPEEIFIKGLVLYNAAVDAESQGKRIAILDQDGEIDQEITEL